MQRAEVGAERFIILHPHPEWDGQTPTTASRGATVKLLIEDREFEQKTSIFGAPHLQTIYASFEGPMKVEQRMTSVTGKASVLDKTPCLTPDPPTQKRHTLTQRETLST